MPTARATAPEKAKGPVVKPGPSNPFVLRLITSASTLPGSAARKQGDNTCRKAVCIRFGVKALVRP